ncbi:MAG: amidohydrolase [Actinomycetota bacterium]
MDQTEPEGEHTGQLAISGGVVLTSIDGDTPTDATVIITDGIVTDLLGPDEPFTVERTINASGSAVLPGFVDCHTHIGSNMLLRGLLEDVQIFEWLETMWKLKRNFDHETLYWASMCGLIEMAKSGITCFNEHFDGYAVTPEVRALDEIGLKATLGYGFADRGIYADATTWSWAAIENFDEAAVGAAEIDGDRVRLALSPHATYSCGEDMWRALRALAIDRGLFLHTHLAEGVNEHDYVQQTYNATPTQWLADIGFLGPEVTAAHCSMMSADDIAVLGEHDVKVAHCPVCNAKLVSGTMDLQTMWSEGITVGLATDGPASHNCLDPFQEMKYAAITHKQATTDPTFLTTRQVITMATREAAKAMHRPELGTIAVGAPADITVVDVSGSHVAPGYDVEATLVYGSRASDVTHTIVDGVVVVDGGEMVGIDEERVVAEFTRHALALRDRSI